MEALLEAVQSAGHPVDYVGSFRVFLGVCPFGVQIHMAVVVFEN